MEILFKDDDNMYYYIDDYNSLVCDYKIKLLIIHQFPNADLTNIPHLDDAKVLYHYKDKRGNMYPVYYEYNDMFITQLGTTYVVFHIQDFYTKDNTLVNLNLL